MFSDKLLLAKKRYSAKKIWLATLATLWILSSPHYADCKLNYRTSPKQIQFLISKKKKKKNSYKTNSNFLTQILESKPNLTQMPKSNQIPKHKSYLMLNFQWMETNCGGGLKFISMSFPLCLTTISLSLSLSLSLLFVGF